MHPINKVFFPKCTKVYIYELKKRVWAIYQTPNKVTFCGCWTRVLCVTVLYFLVLAFILLADEETTAGSCDDYPKVDSAWHGDIDSDADSVDSEEEDPLKWERACFLSHFFLGGGVGLVFATSLYLGHEEIHFCFLFPSPLYQCC